MTCALEAVTRPLICVCRCASVQEQLFLRAVLAEFRRLGLEEATFQQVSRLLFVVESLSSGFHRQSSIQSQLPSHSRTAVSSSALEPLAAAFGERRASRFPRFPVLMLAKLM